MKMKYRNKTFRTAFLEAYLSCLKPPESAELIREFNKDKEFKYTYTKLVYSFHIAHEFFLQRNLYMTDVLYLVQINKNDTDKVYPVYIYKNLLMDLLADYGSEGIQTFVTHDKLIEFLQSYSSNPIGFHPV